MQQSLNFQAVRTLPLIPIEISVPQLGLDAEAVSRSKHAHNSVLQIPGTVYGSELISLKIVITATASSSWTPASIQLFTSAKQYYPWPQTSPNPADEDPELVTNQEYPIPIQYGYGPLDLQIHIPPKLEQHFVSIRLVYSDEQKQSRTVLRKLCFEVVPCVELVAKYDTVVTLKNLCTTDPIAIFDVTVGNDEQLPGTTTPSPDTTFVSIPVDHSAHLLTLKHFVRWTLPTTVEPVSGATALPRNGMILFS